MGCGASSQAGSSAAPMPSPAPTKETTRGALPLNSGTSTVKPLTSDDHLSQPNDAYHEQLHKPPGTTREQHLRGDSNASHVSEANSDLAVAGRSPVAVVPVNKSSGARTSSDRATLNGGSDGQPHVEPPAEIAAVRTSAVRGGSASSARSGGGGGGGAAAGGEDVGVPEIALPRHRRSATEDLSPRPGTGGPGATPRATLSGLLSIRTDAKDPEYFATKLLLLCYNCEDPAAEPVTRCHNCGDDGAVVVFCASCDGGIHKPKKMQEHHREPFDHAKFISDHRATAARPGHKRRTQSDATAALSPRQGRSPRSPVERGFFRKDTTDHLNVPNRAKHHPPALVVDTEDESLVGLVSPRSSPSDNEAIVKSVDAFLDQHSSQGSPSRSRSRRRRPSHSRSPSLSPSMASSRSGRGRNRRPSLSGSLSRSASPRSVSSLRSPRELRNPRRPRTPLSPSPHGRSSTYTFSQSDAKELAKTSVGSPSGSHKMVHDTSVVFSGLSEPQNPMTGNVYAFNSEHVELGDKPVTPEFKLHQLIFNGQVVVVSCGLRHVAAITNNGSLFVWGENRDFQLGVGKSTDPVERPTRVHIKDKGLEQRVCQVACGHRHTACLSVEGDVYTWGTGQFGVLGHGNDDDEHTPRQLQLKSDTETVIHVACGPYNTGIVTTPSAKHAMQSPNEHPLQTMLYVWGANANGQVGDGTTEPRLEPTKSDLSQVPDDHKIMALSFGARHAAAVSSHGGVFTWGDNEFGQLGLGYLGAQDGSARAIVTAPTMVPFFASKHLQIVQVASSANHTTVLDTSGALWSWGSGETHQIGIFDNVDQPTPVLVAMSEPVASMAVGESVCSAVTRSGSVFLWGHGMGTPVPQLAKGLRSEFIQHVPIGDNETMFALTGCTQQIYWWEFDIDGDDIADNQLQLFEPLRGKDLRAASMGSLHAVVATRSGKVYAWGDNDDNQLGTGDDVPRSEPTLLQFPVQGVRSIVAIHDLACGAEHTVALSSTGQVYTWGCGALGRLGHGTEDNEEAPRLVEALANKVVKYIDASAFNTGVIVSGGTAMGFGANNDRQLLISDELPRFAPVELEGVSPLSCLSFGHQHAVGIGLEDHVVRSWGGNDFGQLGVGHTDPVEGVQKVLLPGCADDDEFAQVVSADHVSFARTKAGVVYAWGSGETGQLCTSERDYDDRPTPIKLPFPRIRSRSSGNALSESLQSVSEDGAGLTNAPEGQVDPIVDISAGPANCAALTEAGRVFVWGWVLGSKPTLVKHGNKAISKGCVLHCGPTSLVVATSVASGAPSRDMRLPSSNSRDSLVRMRHLRSASAAATVSTD